MNAFSYNDYDEFEKGFEDYTLDKCSICGNKIELYLEEVIINIGEKFMHFTQLPILRCTNCLQIFLPEYSKIMINGSFEHLVSNNQNEILSRPRGFCKKYDYAVESNFIYDSRDFDSIPGLNIDEEHEKEGFLTPVFFTKKALLYFINDPDYEVDLFSETYGIIRKKSNDAWKYEWDAPFGININGRLIFWLGDLDSMDQMSQNILKPHNIESDHLITRSEFYDAQMNCEFSEPIKEQQIINKRNIAFQEIKNKLGLDLSHLNDEIKEHVKKIQRPMVFTESSIEPVINSLHKILIEGVNLTSFKQLYEEMCSNPQKGYEDWKSIKFYHYLLNEYFIKNDIEDNIDEIVAPLYLLNDLRIYYDHLISSEVKDKLKANILRCLNIDNFKNIEKIYLSLIYRLDRFFQYLVLFSK